MVHKGKEFDSFESLKLNVRTYAVTNGFSFKVIKSDSSRWVICCKQKDCTFQLRAILSEKDKKVRITQLNEEHMCVGTLGGKRGSHTNNKFLVEMVSDKE